MAEIVMVIAQDTFRDEEYAVPRDAFLAAGHRAVTVSQAAGPCVGRFGMTAVADRALADVDGAAADAVVFVGGAGAAAFFDDADAHRVAREAHDAGRVVAAICIAPSVLGRAGLLTGRRVTSFPTQESDLLCAGALWTGEPVEVDRPFVTANGPEAAAAFAAAVLGLIDDRTATDGGPR